MTARWYPIEEADDTLFATAPLYHARSVEVPYSAQETWEALTGDGVSSWTKGMKRLTWTSPRPFGVGTTREIEMGGDFTLRERFFRWEEGHRKTFTGVAGTRSIFRHLVEDYVVEPTPYGARFSWRWAAELNRPWSFFGPALDKLSFAPVGRSHIDGLPGYMATQRAAADR
ncbi:SRPBCC family protein [Streptomyces buecherae]|uniref:SRPBCC family protein n=1 Tax=Streptomyces buecherae TaxID=2763006 RepID=UPI00164EC222|nr:SRPBCC family protein [Streptomyces buecherae]MBC3986891.1 SRPBCC family protein [Streptomyces buecherae]QNJ43633.1 SRPBCC family protein [Streptomyces buecherae]